MKYSATLSSARAYAAQGRLDEWLQLYLNGEGRNLPFSEGLKLVKRYYFSPARFPIDMFERCGGPEPGMKFKTNPDSWAARVAELETSIQNDPDMPPLIVHYVDGGFELNDGNHRWQAYKNLGAQSVWAIVWITEAAERDDFIAAYGEYVKDCVLIQA